MSPDLSKDAILALLLQHFLDLPASRNEEDWPTSAELARLLKLKPDLVKKKLGMLRDAGLIQPMSVSPKRYRFDRYVWDHLDEDSNWKNLDGATEEAMQDWD